jgi:hypothetical protein
VLRMMRTESDKGRRSRIEAGFNLPLVYYSRRANLGQPPQGGADFLLLSRWGL